MWKLDQVSLYSLGFLHFPISIFCLIWAFQKCSGVIFSLLAKTCPENMFYTTQNRNSQLNLFNPAIGTLDDLCLLRGQQKLRMGLRTVPNQIHVDLLASFSFDTAVMNNKANLTYCQICSLWPLWRHRWSWGKKKTFGLLQWIFQGNRKKSEGVGE